MCNAVTPQMYGAKADGVSDDTEAFQRAVDSGFDVFVPSSNGERYLIKRTVGVTDNRCKRIFSEPFFRMDSGTIIADFTDSQRETPMFDVYTNALKIGGIRFASKIVDRHRAGILINAMDLSVCDYDIAVEHCSVKSFFKVASVTGRGFELSNSTIGSCQNLVDLYWQDDADTNNNHPAQYDQRGIMIKNCRLHNIVTGFVNVKSGHAYGLHFVGNTIDNGKGFLFRVYDQAFGWNISGNVIQGIQGVIDVIDLRKGMRNCIISNNTFLSDNGYWVNADGTVRSWIKAAGNTTACVISNNVFKNADGAFLTFKNLDNTSIVGNVMSNKTGVVVPGITITGKATGNTIIGNNATT